MRPNKSGKKNRTRYATILSMTSLVDILSILLIFLLLSFAPEGALLHAAQDLILPESSSKEKVEETDLVVAVTSNGVSVGEHMVATELNPRGELAIPGLGEYLLELAGGEAAERRILVEGDKDVPFETLYAVLFTSHQAGFRKLALAAYERELVEMAMGGGGR